MPKQKILIPESITPKLLALVSEVEKEWLAKQEKKKIKKKK